MATLHLTATTTVADLRKEFNEAFGAQVKVYNGNKAADVSSKLSELGLAKSGNMDCANSMIVDDFIATCKDTWGLKVKVYTSDEWVAVLGALTLEQAGKVKKNATKADMEKMIEIATPDFLKNKIRKILEFIAQEDVIKEGNGFASDKDAIVTLFRKTEEATRQDIFLRLTVIDSTYSTQMTRRYYGLDELSDALFHIKMNNPTKELSTLFIEYLHTKNITPLKYICRENGVETDLFSEKYGIDKKGDDKGIAISLISKYAYFETNGVFPIYDSIACEMIPLIWNKCRFAGKCPSLSENSALSGVEKMNRFIDVLNKFKAQLGVEVSNDHLDRLLWFVGKIIRGNLSLVLSRKDYQWCSEHNFITTIGDETKFRIEKIKLNQLSFLNDQPLLYHFFELAKLLKNK